ncbi:hypothetical protein LTR53_000100 [Teratosphaeriaceae sp. CCFEE 6253]|nr:hypothetical protein LTR53_000100 [Teratosphaeriaceae sp. CCFEE 6253]
MATLALLIGLATLASSAATIALNGKYCVDAGGDKYGILCNIQFSGMVITNSGKKTLMERIPGEADGPMSDIAKRTYAGSFDNCVEFCDEYEDPSAPCMDVAYHDGYCKSYGTITGTFPWRAVLLL